MNKKVIAALGIGAIIIAALFAVVVFIPQSQRWNGITIQLYNDGQPVSPVYSSSWVPQSFFHNGVEIDAVRITAYWEAKGGKTVNLLLWWSEGGSDYQDLKRWQTEDLKSEYYWDIKLDSLFPDISGEQQLDLDFLVQFQLYSEDAKLLDQQEASAGIFLEWKDPEIGFLSWGVIV